MKYVTEIPRVFAALIIALCVIQAELADFRVTPWRLPILTLTVKTVLTFWVFMWVAIVFLKYA